MKISELLTEAPAGTEKGWFGKMFDKMGGAKLAAAKKNFDINRAVTQAYGFWIAHVKKMMDNGVDMKDEEKYLEELTRWMRVRLSIPRNSTILQDMVTFLKTNGMSEGFLKRAMFDAVDKTSTSTERGNRYGTRSSADMIELNKQIIPLIEPLLNNLTDAQKKEVANFVAAKIAADTSLRTPQAVVDATKDYIQKISQGNTRTRTRPRQNTTSPTGSKTVGQQATSKNGRTYTWDGKGWKNAAGTAYASPTTTKELDGMFP